MVFEISQFFSRWQPSCDFKNVALLTVERVDMPIPHNLQISNFVEIGQTIAEIMANAIYQFFS